MQQRFPGQIRPDMDVCDMNGDKIGTVVHAYRYDLARVGGTAGTDTPQYDEVMEVKTGFLGLGARLYIPISAVHDVGAGAVFLSKRRDEIEEGQWEARPEFLDQLD